MEAALRCYFFFLFVCCFIFFFFVFGLFFLVRFVYREISPICGQIFFSQADHLASLFFFKTFFLFVVAEIPSRKMVDFLPVLHT